VLTVNSPKKGKDPDDVETSRPRFVLKLAAAEHADARPALLDKPAQPTLPSVKQVCLVVRDDDPAASHALELAPDFLPFLGGVEMMKKPHRQDKRKDTGSKRKALCQITYYSHRNTINCGSTAGPLDHGPRQVGTHKAIPFLQQEIRKPAVATRRVKG